MNISGVNFLAAFGVFEIGGIVLLVVLLGGLLIYPTFANKKRQAKINELYSTVEVGDKVKTVGGIIGTVIEIREINSLEKEFVLETGNDGSKTTMVFDMQAVYQNLTKNAQNAALAFQQAAEKEENNAQNPEQKIETDDVKIEESDDNKAE